MMNSTINSDYQTGYAETVTNINTGSLNCNQTYNHCALCNQYYFGVVHYCNSYFYSPWPAKESVKQMLERHQRELAAKIKEVETLKQEFDSLPDLKKALKTIDNLIGG